MYITYYSKLRRTNTQEELEEESKKNYGRIVYKETETIRTKANVSTLEKTMNELRTMYNVSLTMLFNEQLTPVRTEHYEVFKIPKAKGGYRTISAPDETIMALQRDVLKWLQKDCKVLPHNAAHGFVKHRNCKSALEAHKARNARWFLKLDVKSFFDNLDPLKVKDAMLNHAGIAASICVYKNAHWVGRIIESHEVVDKILHICMLDGKFPQGAPTSPILSNILMTRVDEAIRLAVPNLCYTRYADDMLFTAPSQFDREFVITKVNEALATIGLEINKEKTRYGNFNGRNWNLGLMYTNEQKITVGSRNKKIIKNRIHNFKTKESCRTTTEWYGINGKLGYYKYIEPEYFADIPLLTKEEFEQCVELQQW